MFILILGADFKRKDIVSIYAIFFDFETFSQKSSL